jgi:hypothetical protein
MSREEIQEKIREATSLAFKIEEYEDEVWGIVYRVILDADAREAFELWLKLVEVFRGIPIVVKWTGKMDMSESELVNYLMKVMAKSGLRPKALEGFDAVKFVRENRDD